MSGGELALQNILIQQIEDDTAKVLRCGDGIGEFRAHIEVFQIEPGEDFAVHTIIQIDQIADHARTLAYRAANRDFQDVVMPVSVWVIALAVHLAILRVRHLLAMQPVRGGKAVATG